MLSMVLSSQQLVAAGRQLEAPFEVELELSGELQIARCVELLRLVPGKRVVVKMLVGEQVFLAKIFLGVDGGKYCQRERAGVQTLQEAGIQTAQLVGQACLKDKGSEVLLLEYLSDVRHLSELIDSREEAGDALLNLAVEMVAKMHDKGLQHKDCHLGNFLVTEQGLYLIDGDAVSKSNRLVQAHAFENLALFFVQLPLFLLPRLNTLFSTYCVLRGWDQKIYQADFDVEVVQQRAKRQRHFLKKIYRDCTQFKVIKSNSRFVVLDREAECPELITLISHFDGAIAEGELLKDGNSATVAKVTEGDKVFVVKRYNIKSFGHLLTRFWRPSRAWLSWRNAQLLAYYGIGTPKPLALIERRCGGLRGRAYFVTEYAAASDAIAYVEQIKNDTPLVECLGRQFSNLFKVMALLRISHGDFKGTNFLVDDSELTVIDLDSMQLHKSEKSYRCAIQKDHQRFMKNWSDNAPVESIMAAATKDCSV
jgi:tRNA A-37 threonylcarbamoyl transferase component Bud32